MNAKLGEFPDEPGDIVALLAARHGLTSRIVMRIMVAWADFTGYAPDERVEVVYKWVAVGETVTRAQVAAVCAEFVP